MLETKRTPQGVSAFLNKKSPSNFVVLILLLLLSHGVDSYVKEYVSYVYARTPGFFMALVDSVLSFLLLFCIYGWKPIKAHKGPVAQHVIVASCASFAVALGSQALQFVSYSVFIVVKSSRLLAVITIGYLVFGKRYSRKELITAAIMIVGLWFMFLDTLQLQGRAIGLLILIVTLFLDAVYGTTQEHLLTKHDCSKQEVLFFQFLIGAGAMLISTLVTDQLTSSIEYSFENPGFIFLILFWSLARFGGLFVVLHAINMYGVLHVGFMTTVRKCLTIVVSFVFFPKKLTVQFVIGATLIIGGGLLTMKSVKKTEEKSSYIELKQEEMDEDGDEVPNSLIEPEEFESHRRHT